MSGNPQIRINLTANTPAFAAVTAEVNAIGREAKNTSAYVAQVGREIEALRPRTSRAGEAVQQVNRLWESARNTVSRLPGEIDRGSRSTENLARNAQRAKVELQDASEAGKTLQQSLSFGLGVNLVDRAMQAFLAGPQMFDQLIERGLAYNQRMETGSLRFEQLLGSAVAARDKMQELSDFAAQTPFELPGLVEGAIALESLTKGALSGQDGLRLVGDAAALAERPFEELSVHIARVYDGLMNNRAVGMSMMRLQELGLVTGDVRAQIENLQQSGAQGNEVWAVMEQELLKASGQMDKLSASAAGLEANLRDVQDATLGKITMPVFEARSAGMAAMIKAMDEIDLTPLVALGETWANAVKVGYEFQEIMARNSGLVAAVVRVGGAIVAGGTIVATARATAALIASYRAWVRANYAQSAYGKQATVTSTQTTAQTAALNANTIAVNNNAIAKRAAAAASAAAANSEMMSAGRRTAWQLQHGTAPQAAQRNARGFSPLRGAGALVGGGALAGAGVAAYAGAIAFEGLIAQAAAKARLREEWLNKRTAELTKTIDGLIYPESEEERLNNLSKAEELLAESSKRIRATHLSIGEFETRRMEQRLYIKRYGDAVKRLSGLKPADIAEIVGRREEIEKENEARAERGRYRDWLDKNSEDIDEDFSKTRLSTLTDAERTTELRERMRSGPAELSKSGVVDVDVAGKDARELTQVILPQMQAQLENIDSSSVNHSRLQVAIKMVQQWASELKEIETEMGTLDARAAANTATAEDLRLERDIAAARLEGNDELVESLEHQREMLKVEQQIESLVKAGVMDRQEAASVLKGMLEDARKLAAQEKANARAQELRDAAGEFSVLQLRAQGQDDEADKLERRLRLQKEVQEVVKATGRDEQWATAYLKARAALEDKIKERKNAEGKGDKGSKGGSGGRPARNWRIDQSGNRLHRTEDGQWLRPEDMSHQQRVATGTATYVRDGAAAVGMRSGWMDTAEDRFLGRNAFAPAADSTADAAFAAINTLAPGISRPQAGQSTPAPDADAHDRRAEAQPAPSALPQAAQAVTTAADSVAGEVTALAATVEAGFERLGAAISTADQTLSQRIEAVAAQVKANRN